MVEKYVAKSELDSALEGLCKKYNVSYGEESKGFGRDLAELSDQLAAADVQAERHAHWVSIPLKSKCEMVKCSICGWGQGIVSASDMNFCDHCGAKMDGEENR